MLQIRHESCPLKVGLVSERCKGQACMASPRSLVSASCTLGNHNACWTCPNLRSSHRVLQDIELYKFPTRVGACQCLALGPHLGLVMDEALIGCYAVSLDLPDYPPQSQVSIDLSVHGGARLPPRMMSDAAAWWCSDLSNFVGTFRSLMVRST